MSFKADLGLESGFRGVRLHCLVIFFALIFFLLISLSVESFRYVGWLCNYINSRLNLSLLSIMCLS